MNEIVRVCKQGALIHIRFPHYTNPATFADPTHKHFFTLQTFKIFTKNFAPKNLYGANNNCEIIEYKETTLQMGGRYCFVEIRVNKE